MKLTVCGSFGFGNAGDEAIPLALQDMLESLGINSDIDVLCRYDRAELPGIIGLGPEDAQRRRAIQDQPLIVAGGGIIEPEAHSTISRCSTFFKKELRDKMVFLGVSADYGVRYKWMDRLRLSSLLRRTGTVYARDILSAHAIKNNFPAVRVETIGDLVLWMKASAFPRSLPALPKRYIAVSLTPRWQDNEWLRWISNELAALATKQGAGLVFVPMSCLHDDDRIEHARVASLIHQSYPEIEIVQVDVPLSPREIAATLGGGLAAVCMRLHGCVMAYAQQTPFIALAYHPKLSGFVQTIEHPWAIIPQKVPHQQSAGVYGYRFVDLKLGEGDLLRGVQRAQEEMTFSSLPVLKETSLSALRRFIEA